ncbi:MAG: class I tRNA ligase family protein, partial [Candidatus Shikimatogenerans sp. JK-2022]|nr:class I tRNA ligase family protein [Candidatus Shikimatogenerans bostrichidophilus]
KSYSDQCQQCGSFIKENTLINPISILSNTIPKKKKTINFYIRFKDKKKFLLKLIKHYKFFKNKKKIILTLKNFIKYGLEDRSITRDINWGIKIPIKKYKNKVLYVWFEAVLGYITSTIDYFINKKKWKKYWFNKKNKLICFIGKDNILFHNLFLPIIIYNYNKNVLLPSYIHANEFLKLNGEKISTSNNWAIFIDDYIKSFPNMEDSLRYSLIKDMPINNDSNFTWEKFKNNNNNELIGIFGNFINRVLVLIDKFNNNRIPKNIILKKKEKKILKYISKYPSKIGKLILNFEFKLALKKFIKLSIIGNKYLSYNKPWELKNKQKIKRNTILFIVSQIIGYITHLSIFFLPKTHKVLLKIINMKEINLLNFKKKKYIIPFNKKIKKKKIIFRKIKN